MNLSNLRSLCMFGPLFHNLRRDNCRGEQSVKAHNTGPETTETVADMLGPQPRRASSCIRLNWRVPTESSTNRLATLECYAGLVPWAATRCQFIRDVHLTGISTKSRSGDRPSRPKSDMGGSCRQESPDKLQISRKKPFTSSFGKPGISHWRSLAVTGQDCLADPRESMIP